MLHKEHEAEEPILAGILLISIFMLIIMSVYMMFF